MANDDISDILDMSPLDEVSIEDRKKVLPTVYRETRQNVDEVETDLEYVRKNLYDLIEKGQGAVDELLNVADQSQHPRAYEVLANMIKTMVETNKDLISLHHEKNKLKGEDKQIDAQTVNNNLFVGSTADLLKMMNRENDGSD